MKASALLLLSVATCHFCIVCSWPFFNSRTDATSRLPEDQSTPPGTIQPIFKPSYRQTTGDNRKTLTTSRRIEISTREQHASFSSTQAPTRQALTTTAERQAQQPTTHEWWYPAWLLSKTTGSSTSRKTSISAPALNATPTTIKRTSLTMTSRWGWLLKRQTTPQLTRTSSRYSSTTSAPRGRVATSSNGARITSTSESAQKRPRAWPITDEHGVRAGHIIADQQWKYASRYEADSGGSVRSISPVVSGVFGLIVLVGVLSGLVALVLLVAKRRRQNRYARFASLNYDVGSSSTASFAGTAAAPTNAVTAD